MAVQVIAELYELIASCVGTAQSLRVGSEGTVPSKVKIDTIFHKERLAIGVRVCLHPHMKIMALLCGALE